VTAINYNGDADDDELSLSLYARYPQQILPQQLCRDSAVAIHAFFPQENCSDFDNIRIISQHW